MAEDLIFIRSSRERCPFASVQDCRHSLTRMFLRGQSRDSSHNAVTRFLRFWPMKWRVRYTIPFMQNSRERRLASSMTLSNLSRKGNPFQPVIISVAHAWSNCGWRSKRSAVTRARRLARRRRGQRRKLQNHANPAGRAVPSPPRSGRSQ